MLFLIGTKHLNKPNRRCWNGENLKHYREDNTGTQYSDKLHV